MVQTQVEVGHGGGEGERLFRPRVDAKPIRENLDRANHGIRDDLKAERIGFTDVQPLRWPPLFFDLQREKQMRPIPPDGPAQGKAGQHLLKVPRRNPSPVDIQCAQKAVVAAVGDGRNDPVIGTGPGDGLQEPPLKAGFSNVKGARRHTELLERLHRNGLPSRFGQIAARESSGILKEEAVQLDGVEPVILPGHREPRALSVHQRRGLR